jgi:signal transduction histidine kinase
MPPTRRELRHVILPLVAGVLMAVTPAIPYWLGLVDFFDPLWARAVLAGLCFAVAGLVAVDAPRRLVHVVVFALHVASMLWCGMVLWGNAFPGGYSAGVFIVLASAVVSFRRVVVTVGYVVASTAIILVAGACTSEPGIPPTPFALHFLATGLVLAAATAFRQQLLDRLRAARRGLEREVAQRTEALAREVEERREAERLAMSASEAKSRFLANMSHELRTPLNAILGYGELLRDELEDGADPQSLVRDLDQSLAAAHNLLHLVDDILDLTKIEADALELRSDTVVLEPVASAVFARLRPLLAEGVTPRVDIPDGLAVATDANRLDQVLTNLVSNAARFTAHGEITIRARTQGSVVELEVADTGSGIDTAALPTVFDRFSQADDSSTREHGGTGLGLALCRELVERMGGSIRVRSPAGEGATFTVRLPRAQCP